MEGEKKAIGLDLSIALSRYITGTLSYFNHRSNVDINSRLVCFDLKEMNSNQRFASSPAWFSITIKFVVSRIFCISGERKRSLIFCVIAVGIPPELKEIKGHIPQVQNKSIKDKASEIVGASEKWVGEVRNKLQETKMERYALSILNKIPLSGAAKLSCRTSLPIKIPPRFLACTPIAFNSFLTPQKDASIQEKHKQDVVR